MSRFPFAIVPFDRTSESHASFLFDAVRKRAFDWPYTPDDRDWLVETVRKAIVGNGRSCVVAVDPDDPDTFFGVAVVAGPREVVFAYTKQALRGPGAFEAPVGTPRAPGCPPVCTTLLQSVGCELELPTSVAIWSVAASRIAARGYPLFPAIP